MITKSAARLLTAARQLLSVAPTGLWYHGRPGRHGKGLTMRPGVSSTSGGPAHAIPLFLSPAKSFARLYTDHHGYVYTVRPHVHKTFDAYDLQTPEAKWHDAREDYTEEGKQLFDDLHDGKIFPGMEDDEEEFLGTLKAILRMNYDVMEDGHMVNWLKKNGYDSFYVTGDGEKNLAVFDLRNVEVIDVELVGNPDKF